LQTANQELRRLNELKSNFLANVSHELRTPLTSIRSFSEILLNYPDEDVFTRSEFLEIIMAETDRLTRLINDVLDLAKIEAGRVEWRLEPLRVTEAVRETLDVIQVVAAHKRVRLINLVGNDSPLIAADGDRLRQVLTNLLSNALKFTSAGSIQVGTLERPGELVLYVADTGAGMPQGDLERIFDKFYQRGDVMTAKPSGTGLGLSICREIMHHHGGRIWAESVEGQGSTFYCMFPKYESGLSGAGAAASEVKVSGRAGQNNRQAEAGVAQILPERDGQQHAGQDNEEGGQHGVAPAAVGRALAAATEHK
jgi:signal transduction histidine kinase